MAQDLSIVGIDLAKLVVAPGPAERVGRHPPPPGTLNRLGLVH